MLLVIVLVVLDDGDLLLRLVHVICFTNQLYGTTFAVIPGRIRVLALPLALL